MKLDIYKLGIDYWNKAKEVGSQLKVLTPYQLDLCDIAIKFIKRIYPSLSKKQIKEIWEVKKIMDNYLQN